ncbi:MAG: prepilin peptidase [Clostridium sp.]
MFCFYTYGFSWDTVLVFAVFMILFTITMIDFDTMTIPNGLLLALLVPVGIFTALHTEMDIVTRCIGFFIVSLPMYLLTVLIPDCFGGGDIKLIAVAGFLLGWKLTLLAFFISVISGGCYAICLLCPKKRKKVRISRLALIYAQEL